MAMNLPDKMASSRVEANTTGYSAGISTCGCMTAIRRGQLPFEEKEGEAKGPPKKRKRHSPTALLLPR
eukprot:6890617-Prorocentrum_lima.AAC.1